MIVCKNNDNNLNISKMKYTRIDIKSAGDLPKKEGYCYAQRKDKPIDCLSSYSGLIRLSLQYLKIYSKSPSISPSSI